MAIDLWKIAEQTVGKPKWVDLSAIARSTVAPQKQTFWQQLKQSAQQFIAPAAWVVWWLWNVMEKTTWRAMDYLWWKIFWQWYQPVQWTTEAWARALLWNQQQWAWYKIWEFVWEALPSFAAGAWLWWLATKWWLVSRLWVWAGKGALQTQASNLLSEWKFATAWETALWAGIWLWLQWAWELISKVKPNLYTKAFSQTKKSVAEKWYELSWKTPWELVMEQNLSPSVKKWITQIKDQLQSTWKQIEQTADKAGNIKWWAVRWWLKQDLISRLWFDKLPKNAQSTKDLIARVWSIVDDYVPNWNIKPQELLQQIKNINKTLPTKLLSMWIQDPTSSKWFSQALSKWLKKVLDDKVAAWGGWANKILDLYKEYWKKKTVEAILKDENLRKTLWRQLVWTSVWAWIGTVAWFQDIQEWDLIWWWLKIIWWAIAGKTAANLANNPSFLMKLWKAADAVVKKWIPNIQKWAAYLASKIKK